ncbi:nucleotide pyrophosphohydrolase [Limosilactobacillus gastricus]|uniref:nucleotide pyrophosphohydrolase n=1 Tax=Limosilactobacillus gastricus TaxID=227942 RepID=UPI00031FC99D|nr:nucleotide pyrophosphohydrolase [Limosilactobacillus gastricus]
MDSEVMDQLKKFRDSRGWEKYHNLKDLAVATNVEAGELLEIFLWKDKNEKLTENQIEHVKEEIADTMMYLFYMCDNLGVDPNEIIMNKINFNKQRTWWMDNKE